MYAISISSRAALHQRSGPYSSLGCEIKAAALVLETADANHLDATTYTLVSPQSPTITPDIIFRKPPIREILPGATYVLPVDSQAPLQYSAQSEEV